MAPSVVGLYLLILVVVLAAAAYVLWRRYQSRRALQQRLTELARLSELGRNILNAPLDSRRLAEFIYREAGQVVDTTFFQLGLFEGDRYRMLIWVADGRPQTPILVRLAPDSPGIVGWVRAQGQPLLIGDFEAERDTLPARPRYLAADPPRSAVFVPLTAGDRTLGAMAIQSRRAHAFSEEHLRLLSIIANTAAAALENARLFEQTERRAAQLELLAEVARRINVLQPLPAFYRQVVELISEQFREYLVSLFTLEAHTLCLAATTRADWRGQRLELPLEAGLVGEAARTQRTAVAVPAAPAEGEIATPAPAWAEIAVPLMVEARVLGVLNAQSQTEAFDEAASALFESLAAQIAFATLEAQVYAREQQRADQLAAIAQASRSVVSTLELDAVLEDVLELVEDRFGYDRARIFLLQDGQLVYRAGSEAWEARWGHQPLAYDLEGPGLIALVGRTQKPVLVPEVQAHSDYRPGPGLGDTQTEMAVPLVMGQRLLGVFDVQSEAPAAFADDDLQTLQTLADTLAVAVRNARLFEAERRRRRLAETLREISGALTTTLTLDEVLALILGGLARVVTYNAAAILLVNDMGEMSLRAAQGDRAGPLTEALGLPLAVRRFGEGEALPATLAFDEVDLQREYHDLLRLPDPHACLAAPLLVQKLHLGYLVVDRAGEARFPVEEVELIAAFASQASVALENTRLLVEQREQAWVSTALLQVAESIAQTPRLEDALATVAHITPMLVGVEWCAVLLAEGEAFNLRAAYHAEVQVPADLALAPGEWPRLAEMMATREPVVVEPDEAAPEALAPLLTNVAILLPLWVKGEILGAMCVGQAPGEAPFTSHSIRLMGGIANQAALALESALLDEARQEEAWVNAALLQVAEAVASQPTLEAGLETVARLTPMLVGLERVAIYRWHGEPGLFRPSRCVGFVCDPQDLTVTAAELEIDPHQQTSSLPGLVCALPERLRAAFGSELARVWPLWARGELFGALVVELGGDLGRRQNILNGIAHQLSMAMENEALAREVAQQQRLEREIELGRDIQASFLPDTSPQVAGWDMAAFWRSARLVGGDFYDFIPLKSSDGVERWGIAIADVSDKGVPAALFMALSRTLLRSAAMHRTSPGATLTRLNEMILSDARSPQFVTVFYAVWEPSTGRVVFANAGHNPPVLVRADGAVELLKIKGAALAVFAEYYYHQAETLLAPGDTLLMYTDGLPDAINLGEEEFGMERLVATLSAARDASASDIITRLAHAVEQHVGERELFDDTTMVILQRATLSPSP